MFEIAFSKATSGLLVKRFRIALEVVFVSIQITYRFLQTKNILTFLRPMDFFRFLLYYFCESINFPCGVHVNLRF